MKYCILLFCLLSSGSLFAQQAKAYELVHYVAERDGNTYLLNYADGYPAASRVKIKQSNHITLTFQPVNGVADKNGDLIFITSRSKQAGSIILHGIDENSTAPAVLKATYVLRGHKLILMFVTRKERW